MSAARNVRTIPATKNRFTSAPIGSPRKRRVAGYARVSTDHDEQFTSYEAQVDYYTKYIKSRDDWEFVAVYTDEGITGTSTKRREGFKAMVADALGGKIDLIVTKSVSRFARNTVDSLTTIRELKEHGCECFFEKENIWTFDSKGELLITIMSSLAQEESRSISENCTWGQRKRFADGKVTVPFSRFLGYDRGDDGNLVVNEEQAKTVRRIYSMFLKGSTPFGIAKALTEDGVPAPAGGAKWSQTTVKSILTNEKYKGDALLQKSYIEDFLTKKQVPNNGEIPQYYVEGNHEAIVSAEVFDMAQRELERRKAARTRHSGVHLLSGRIACGCCGGTFGSKVWHSGDEYRRVVWQCNRKYKGGGKCAAPHVTEDEMRAAFVSAANKMLATRQTVCEDFKAMRDALYSTAALEAERTALADEVEVSARLIDEAISANARAAQDQDAYQRRYDELVARYDSAREKLDSVEAQIAHKTSVRDAIEAFLRELESREAVMDGFDADAFCALVDHVTVYAKSDIRVTFRNGMEVGSGASGQDCERRRSL